MAREPRSQPSATCLLGELIDKSVWVDFIPEEVRRKSRPIPFADFADEVLARSVSYRARIALVLEELARIPGVATSFDITHPIIYKWLLDQHERGRPETVILGFLEVLEAIIEFGRVKGRIRDTPFVKGDPPSRWFANGTFGPRRFYTHGPPEAKDPSPRRQMPRYWVGTFSQLQRDISGIQSEAQRAVFMTLLKAHLERPPRRLTQAQIIRQSQRGDAVNHLRRLADSGSPLAKAIDFPGKGGKGTGLRIDLL